MSFSELALLPWPGIAPSSHLPHPARDAARIYQSILDSTPDAQLATAAVDVARDEHILDRLGTDPARELTGTDVRRYLAGKLDQIVDEAEVQGVGGQYVAAITGAGPDDVYDAAIVLGEVLNTWPVVAARLGAPVAQQILTAVETALPAGGSLSRVEVPLYNGMVDGDVRVTFGDRDDAALDRSVERSIVDNVQLVVAREYPDLNGELIVQGTGNGATLEVVDYND